MFGFGGMFETDLINNEQMNFFTTLYFNTFVQRGHKVLGYTRFLLKIKAISKKLFSQEFNISMKF